MSQPNIEVNLSRRYYRLGGTVVGTIRVIPSDDGLPRNALQSLVLSAIGFCRLDPRWHSASEFITKFTEMKITELPPNLPMPPNTAAFWASNSIELMDLKERTKGSWNDTKPKPIIIPGKSELKQNGSTHSNEELCIALEDQHTAFSFRVNLPSNAPHTLIATSCRYYYTITLRFRSNETEEYSWMHVPVMVLSAIPSVRQSELRIPPLQAMAHSAGLPVSLTATELNQLDGQYSVNRDTEPTSIQSTLVRDPNSGRSACFLTILGAGRMCPGSTLVLKLDFPNPHHRHKSANPWIPCYSASACLEGEEWAIGTSRKRAKKHLFCTAHQSIDPDTTECVSLRLHLPISAPCSIQTEAIDINIRCIIDIAVGTPSGDGYRNVHLEIPCQVTHALSDWERPNEDDDESSAQRAFEDLLHSRASPCCDPLDPESFTYDDIQEELKILSLAMADACRLRPGPIGTS
jgi:hypothetical protein